MQQTFKATGFSFTKIVILESLEEHDPHKTGETLKTVIDGFVSDAGMAMPVELVRCVTKDDVLNTLERLITEATTEEQIPVIHFECHGNPDHGLFCADDTVVDWGTLGRYLTRLNKATGLNLLAVFAACHGGYFLKNLSPLAPSPCWAMVGPTESIDPADAMGGFRSFYRVAINDRDIGLAAAALKGHSLANGRWLSQHCEIWFESVVKNYVVRLCNKEATRKRAKAMHRQSVKQGTPKSIGFFIRALKNLNRQNLSGKFFDSYFMVHEIPSNDKRFAPMRIRIERLLQDLRGTGLYIV
jgi:hypothetical protein